MGRNIKSLAARVCVCVRARTGIGHRDSVTIEHL